MNLLVKSPVWDDLRETGLRIAAENPGAADRFLTAARESFEFLRRHPRIGSLRSFLVPKTILHSAFHEWLPALPIFLLLAPSFPISAFSLSTLPYL
jgi:plasmid stabilization system protein ParE